MKIKYFLAIKDGEMKIKRTFRFSKGPKSYF